MKSFFLTLLFAAALAAQDKPAWIDNPQSQYSSAKYLSAVGGGDTRKSAESDAAAKLTMIFQSTIRAEQAVTDRYKELFTSPQNSTYEQQSEVTKNTSISSGETLYNFQIAETFTDNLGKTYALAVIERGPTAEIYEKKIAENEKVMTAYVNAFTGASDPVEKYASINAAAVFSTMNESLKKQLLIIMPGQTVQPAPGYDDVTIRSLLNGARKNIPFSISIANDPDGKAVSILKEMLTEMGFVVAERGVLRISGDISFEKIDLKRPEQFVRWNYNLSVRTSSNVSIVSLSENGREGHVTYEEAVARAARTMKQKIKKNFSRQIDAYFDSLVKK
ncbi:MAG: LPP20 family lipoprotein [Bacteroidota bacterium]|jgi:hypothetical protein